MYVATTKDEGNAAEGRFSTACQELTAAAHSQGGHRGPVDSAWPRSSQIFYFSLPPLPIVPLQALLDQ